MTDLFTEAVRDAEKLMEIAEADAKKALIEQLTPYIKRVIVKEAVGSSDFFFEQEEEEEQVPPPADPQGMGGPMATTAPADTVDPTQGLDAGLGDEPTEAPVPAPEGENLVGASMPDEDGKIVVDFEDLFVDADTDQVTITPGQAPVQPTGAAVAPEGPEGTEGTVDPAVAPAPETAEPAPVQATPEEEEEVPALPTEAVTYKEYKRVLSNISERIDRAYFTGRVTDIKRSALKQRLIDLIEALDGMQNRGLITNKQARLNENKLEFLFLKLKEAGLEHSYLKKEQGKGTDMTSLKEFAAKLFEEDENLAKDSAHTGESGMKVDDEYSEHAAEVSGVDPHLGGTEDIEVAQEEKLVEEMHGGSAGSVDADPISGKPHKDHPWDEGEPVVDEDDQEKTVTRSMNENSADADPNANDDVAEGAAGFGDTHEEPAAEFEVDDKELAEAVRAIRKENIKRKLEALREASDGKEEKSWEDAEPEGGEDGSLDNLKEGMYEMDLDEMMHEDDLEVEDDADLVLSVDLPPEVEEELAALGVDDLDVDVDLNVAGEDEEVEIVDDEEGDLDDMGSAEEDLVLADEMEEGMHMESKAKHLARKNALLEKKLRRAVKLLEARKQEVSNLNKQLVETNLFTSKAVYYSKFLQRALSEKALTKKALQQIVEHLDKGASVAETKAIYTKIKRRLDEHASASRKLGGSSSKVTKPGSANLTEAAQPQAGHNSDGQSANRWQVLAGIKKGD